MKINKTMKILVGIQILAFCLLVTILSYLAQQFERTKAGKEVGAFVDEWFTPEGE